MQLRKFSGYAAYPLLAALFLAPSFVRAQQTPQSLTMSRGVPNPPQHHQQTPEDSVQILREAQARVNARREQRIREIIRQTYNHKYEIYFGGGYLRFRPGSSLQHNSETSWNVGISDYFRGRLGATADFRGYYGVAYTGRNPYSVYEPSISQYTFLAGPSYRFYEGQHWGWTAHVLAGAGHGNFGTGTNGLPPHYVGLYSDSTVFNASAAASVDYNFSETLAWRLTPNLLASRYGGQWQENLGWNMGLVYRFGHQGKK
jgi:hypothetical protein